MQEGSKDCRIAQRRVDGASKIASIRLEAPSVSSLGFLFSFDSFVSRLDSRQSRSERKQAEFHPDRDVSFARCAGWKLPSAIVATTSAGSVYLRSSKLSSSRNRANEPSRRREEGRMYVASVAMGMAVRTKRGKDRDARSKVRRC